MYSGPIRAAPAACSKPTSISSRSAVPTRTIVFSSLKSSTERTETTSRTNSLCDKTFGGIRGAYPALTLMPLGWKPENPLARMVCHFRWLLCDAASAIVRSIFADPFSLQQDPACHCASLELVEGAKC